jgi:hypothetical protein
MSEMLFKLTECWTGKFGYKSAYLVPNAGYLKLNVQKRRVFCLPFPCKRGAGTLMSLGTSFSPQ